MRPKLQLARALGSNAPPRSTEQLALLNEAKRLSPTDPDAATELGVFYLQSGNPREALAEFNVVIEKSGRTPSVLANAGAAYFLLGDTARAIEAFTEAIENDPCHFDARNNLLLVHRRQATRDTDRTRAAEIARLPPGCRLPQEQAEALATAQREIADQP